MKWITRQGIRVNRTATCWLILRFLDPEAEFVFVPADQVAFMQEETGATGFDAPGATYPHKDEQGLCSFTALVHERLTGDPVLWEMARIVQAADIRGQWDDHPAARGLVFLMESSGLYNQNQLITFVNSRLNKDVSMSVSYVLNRALSNTDGLGTFRPSRTTSPVSMVRHSPTCGIALR